MRLASLPERSATNLPTPCATWKSNVVHVRVSRPVEFQAKLVCTFADDVVLGTTDQVFAEAIDQCELSPRIEGEDRDVDLGHYRTEERCRFLRANPLRVKSARQRVDLEHHHPERIAFASIPRTNGKIAFSKSSEKIRNGLKPSNDAISRTGGDFEPQVDDQCSRCRAIDRRVRAKPEKNRCGDNCRQSCGQIQQEDSPVVINHWSPYRSSRR